MATVRGRLREFGELAEFSVQGLRQVPGTGRYFSEVVRQAAILARGSWFMIAALAVFIGISETNYGYYFLKAAGAADFTGLVSGFANPRATAPFILGYAFAAKVGCGLASEIGTMRINDEISAAEAEAIDPMRYLVATRIAAGLLFAPIAGGIALVATTVGAYVNSIFILRALSPTSFLQYHWGIQAVPDQLFAFATIMVVATTIILVSCFYGYRASGGPSGVGQAVARSLVVNLIAVHVITGVAVFVVYGTDPHLPIGG